MMHLILSSIAAAAILAAGLHAAIRLRTAAHVAFLVTALLLAGIEVFDDLFIKLNAGLPLFRHVSLIAESLLPLSFLFVVLLYGRKAPFEGQTRTGLSVQLFLAAAPAAMLLFSGTDLYFSPDFRTDQILFLENRGYWFYLLVMVSLIFSLVAVEGTLAAADDAARNRLKFEVFGLMSILAVLIFYYSQALLYRTINMNLAPVRSSVLIIGSLLVLYSNAFRGNAAPVTVSRHVFYRSISLLVVGVYLIGLALLGEGMRYLGVTFGRQLMIVLAFAGGVFVLAILLSDKARRRANVYIRKHFYEHKHDYRDEWIKLTDRLSNCTTLDAAQDAIIRAYLDTFGLAGASLYQLAGNEKRYVRVSGQGMPHDPVQIVLSDELRTYFLSRDRVLNPGDGEHALTPAEADLLKQARAFLVIPLICNGKLEALLMLREQLLPGSLIYDDYDLMKVMARQAAQAIANIRLSEEVIEMRAMSAVATISSFVIHDLKNLISSLSLVVYNAERHIGNPDFQKDAIKTIGDTLLKMRALMQRLKEIPEKNSMASGVVDIDALARETVRDLRSVQKEARIDYSGTCVLSRIDPEEIKKVIVNLVRNGLEAGRERAAVEVKTFAENGNACIRVTDNGAGMTGDFVKNRLFRPFSTTKDKGLGIGLYQCRQIVEAHEGRIEVASEVNRGTTFTVCLPAVKERAGSDADA